MRGTFVVVAGLVLVAGCNDPTPTGTVGTQEPSPSLSHSGRHDGENDDRGRGRRTFELRLRAANEIPTSTSISKGSAHLRVPSTGTITSTIEIDNRGDEVIRFCHIHWIDPANEGTPGAGTGPIVWFLTPVGVSTATGPGLQLVSSFFVIGQDADYVANGPFGPDNAASEAAARAAFRSDPTAFYVNCHSNAFPAGFVRGDFPTRRSHRD